MARQRDLPLVAIGAIKAHNLEEVLLSGVGSVAVVSAITAAPDPEAAASDLLQRMRGWTSPQ